MSLTAAEDPSRAWEELEYMPVRNQVDSEHKNCRFRFDPLDLSQPGTALSREKSRVAEMQVPQYRQWRRKIA